MSFCLQDKNAGNLGDYLKHFYLLRLINGVIELAGTSSVAYIDTHAGAGVYTMEKSHWDNRERNRRLVNDCHGEWEMFDRLNPDVEKKRYLGSFVLAGELFTENGRIKSKMLIFEKDEAVCERIKKDAAPLLPQFSLGPFGKADPVLIESGIRELKSGDFDKVICLIDPFRANKTWARLLDYDVQGCFVLLFDYSNRKDLKTSKWHWNCGSREPIVYKEDPDSTKAYALFGNSHARALLRTIKTGA